VRAFVTFLQEPAHLFRIKGWNTELQPLNGMSRLDAIRDWEDRARAAGYDFHVLAMQVGVCERQLRWGAAATLDEPLEAA
jgi:hypothetical protein